MTQLYKSFLVIFGFIELILRVLFVIIMSLFIVPLVLWVLNDNVQEMITPYLWRKL